jgi:DMATS type aromatic prenyltransferase
MQTLTMAAKTRLEVLCNGLPGGPTLSEATPIIEAMMAGWGERSVTFPPFPSHIGDDHSPFEFSLAFAGALPPELRLLVEAQAEGPSRSLEDTRDAGLELNERLRRQFDLPLERFDSVRELFLPSKPRGAFALWHAVCLSKGRPPEFKIYLNPQSRGPEHARAVVREALERLGLEACVSGLFERGGYRGSKLDEVRYFSLDLSRSGKARVKVYYRHHEATAAALEKSFAYASSHRPGDVRAFLERMAPGVERFELKPVGSCFSYVQGEAEPLAATLHVPIAHYAANDRVSAERVAEGLAPGAVRDGYMAMLEAFSERALAEGSGLQSYASFRREAGGLRTTVYISPEVYQPSMFHPKPVADIELEHVEQGNDNAHTVKRTA